MKTDWVKIGKAWSLLTQIGIMFIICIFGCFFIGRKIDVWLGSKPIFSLVFLLLGIGGGFSGAYRTLKPFFGKKK